MTRPDDNQGVCIAELGFDRPLEIEVPDDDANKNREFMISTKRVESGFKRSRPKSSKPPKRDALDDAIIGDMSVDLIDHMTRDELVRVILAAKLPTLTADDMDWRLPMYECETLRRLAYRSRQCCRYRHEQMTAKAIT